MICKLGGYNYGTNYIFRTGKIPRGFVTAGPDAVVNITAETTLTFAAHAGKVIKVNDDGAITLPTIKADSKDFQLETTILM